MRFVLFLLGAIAAALAVATMVPADLTPQVRLGICAGAGLGGPALVVFWAWIELKGRPRLRKIAPWVAGLIVQGVVVAVPMLYGKQPQDAFAVVKTVVKQNVDTATVAAHAPVIDTPVEWRAKWVASVEGPGLEVVSDVFVDRTHGRVLVSGSSRRPATVFVSARSIDDGAELWTHRFPVDESGVARVIGVGDDGSVRLGVGLVGVLTLPDGREIGKRVRQISAWSLRIAETTVAAEPIDSARTIALPGGDLVMVRRGSLARIAPDGTVRWSHTTKRLGYELSRVGSRVYAFAEPGGAGAKIPKLGERLVVDIESGDLVERGPWFDAPAGNVRASVAAAPGGDVFLRAVLPYDVDPPAYRPDGTTVERTGDSEILVERVDEHFGARWSVRFSNEKFEQSFERIVVPAGPWVLPSGAVLVAGSFATAVDLGQGPVAPIGGSDLFVAELDPNDGRFRAAQRFGGTGTERLGAAVADGGDLFLGGRFRDALSIGDVTRTAPPRNGDHFARHEAFVAFLSAR